MPDRLNGTLKLVERHGDKKLFIERENKKGEIPVTDTDLKLMMWAAGLESVAVTFEFSMSRVAKVEIVDPEIRARALAALSEKKNKQAQNIAKETQVFIPQPPPRADRSPADRPAHRPHTAAATEPPVRTNYESKFHNPYNFVPAPPRKLDHPELGDHAPAGHDAYLPGHYSGTLTVRMTTVTPLLAIDTSKVSIDNNDHKTYPVLIDKDGKPRIDVTAVKGMLRSAYEAITNSRFSVFSGTHKDRLALRSEADVARYIKAARVEDCGTKLRIFDKKPAALKRYRKHGLEEPRPDKHAAGGRNRGLKVSPDNTELPTHGMHVWARIEDRFEWRNNRRTDRHLGLIATEIRDFSSNVGLTGFEESWIVVSGPNMENKVYERVFAKSDNDRVIALTKAHKAMWEGLVQNYQKQHEDEIKKRRRSGDKPEDFLGNNPGETAFSRHVYEPKDREFGPGTLCYVLEEGGQVAAIFPVMVSRRLYEKSPLDLLDKSLQPASAIDQLSPADRVWGCVFGTKTEAGIGGYKGQVRIRGMKSLASANVMMFNNPLPLNILGQPKPQQGRFYVAETAGGEAQKFARDNLESGYKANRGLRGRKVYPHHKNLPSDFWVGKDWATKEINGDLTQNHLGGGFFREYIRPKSAKRRNNQNRSIEGWVAQGSEFEFSIDFSNLTKVELGALLWLLKMDSNHFHRLGGGKPLGFGSVRVEIESTKSDIAIGGDLVEFYSGLNSGSRESNDTREAMIAKAIEAFVDVADNRILESFRVACKGFGDGKPIQYPRTKKYHTNTRYDHAARRRVNTSFRWVDGEFVPPNAEGKSFEWFVANSKVRIQEELNDQMMVKERCQLVLDNIWDEGREDRGLPLLPRKQ